MQIKIARTASRTKIVLPLAALALMLLSGCAAEAGSDFDASKEVALPSWQLDFQNINPAIKMAAAYGDRGTGAHGSFGTFPPNFTTPFHSHTGAYHGVVIEGVMTNPFEGEEDPPTLEPGSYWYVPAESVHATACVSNVPCSFYFHAGQAFDFKPAE